MITVSLFIAVAPVPELYNPDDFSPFTSKVPERLNFPSLEIAAFFSDPVILIVPVFSPWAHLSTYIPVLSLPPRIIFPVFLTFILVDAAVPVADSPVVCTSPLPTVIFPLLYICCVCPLECATVFPLPLVPVVVMSACIWTPYLSVLIRVLLVAPVPILKFPITWLLNMKSLVLLAE